MRSNREKKKPKSDKNKTKNAPSTSPFAPTPFTGKPTRGHTGKKGS
jgi:hypothetical protein